MFKQPRKKSVHVGVIVAWLDMAIADKKPIQVLQMYDSAILNKLKLTDEVPNWDRFPLARTYFTQMHQSVTL